MSAYAADDLLTTSQVAALRNVYRQTVTVWCQSGDLPCRRVGRDYLIRYADAMAFQPAPRGRPADKTAAKSPKKRRPKA